MRALRVLVLSCFLALSSRQFIAAEYALSSLGSRIDGSYFFRDFCGLITSSGDRFSLSCVPGSACGKQSE
jgi:hypothetical protein